jgi:hypothetical protein
MTDSTASPTCALCGGPLDDHDRDRETCHDCRSPKGKIADLDVAVRASGDNPERIGDWPVIRHLLRKRFGEDRSDTELWERCTDWLRAEGRLAPNDYLPQPLDYLQWTLEHGFIPPDQESAISLGPPFGPNLAQPVPRVKAGGAFLWATETDSGAKAALQRARDRLQAFAKAMQEAMDSPEYQAAQEAERQRWQALADAICETLKAAGDELESRHFARPETIEDLEHLARIVEIPTETIRTGNLTAREISACALAWADRQTIKKDTTNSSPAIIEAGEQAEATPATSEGPSPIAKTESGSVLLFGRKDNPVVKGNEKPTLTNAQYDVVLALLQTGDKGLTKDDLDHESRHGDARKILRRLSEADSDWQSVISFPGTTGKGYRIV